MTIDKKIQTEDIKVSDIDHFLSLDDDLLDDNFSFDIQMDETQVDVQSDKVESRLSEQDSDIAMATYNLMMDADTTIIANNESDKQDLSSRGKVSKRKEDTSKQVNDTPEVAQPVNNALDIEKTNDVLDDFLLLDDEGFDDLLDEEIAQSTLQQANSHDNTLQEIESTFSKNTMQASDKKESMLDKAEELITDEEIKEDQQKIEDTQTVNVTDIKESSFEALTKQKAMQFIEKLDAMEDGNQHKKIDVNPNAVQATKQLDKSGNQEKVSNIATQSEEKPLTESVPKQSANHSMDDFLALDDDSLQVEGFEAPDDTDFVQEDMANFDTLNLDDLDTAPLNLDELDVEGFENDVLKDMSVTDERVNADSLNGSQITSQQDAVSSHQTEGDLTKLDALENIDNLGSVDNLSNLDADEVESLKDLANLDVDGLDDLDSLDGLEDFLTMDDEVFEADLFADDFVQKEEELATAIARIVEFSPNQFIALSTHVTMALIDEPKVTPVEHTPSHLVGLIPWQSQMIPLFDLSQVLPKQHTPDDKRDSNSKQMSAASLEQDELSMNTSLQDKPLQQDNTSNTLLSLTDQQRSFALVLAYQPKPNSLLQYGAMLLQGMPKSITVTNHLACDLPPAVSISSTNTLNPVPWDRVAHSCILQDKVVTPIVNTSWLFTQDVLGVDFMMFDTSE